MFIVIDGNQGGASARVKLSLLATVQLQGLMLTSTIAITSVTSVADGDAE
jgi:hypothetical protein